MRWLAAFLILGSVACGESPADAPDAGTIGGSQSSDAGETVEPLADCVRDPDLMDNPPDCLIDAVCPCGMSCSPIGLCEAPDCRADEDCGPSQVCNRFGRCMAADEDASLEPPSTDAQGWIRLRPARLFLSPAHPSRSMTITAMGSGIEAARLQVPQGFEVRCGAGEDTTDECLFASLRAGEERSVEVFATEQLAEDVSLHSGSVVVQRAGGAVAVDLIYVPPADAATAPLAGVYGGTARLVSLADNPLDGDQRILAGVTLIVQQQSASRGFVALDDRSGRLGIGRTLTGRVEYDANGQVDGLHFGRHTLDEGARVTVTTGPAFSMGGGSADGLIHVTTDHGGVETTLTWHLGLSRLRDQQRDDENPGLEGQASAASSRRARWLAWSSLVPRAVSETMPTDRRAAVVPRHPLFECDGPPGLQWMRHANIGGRTRSYALLCGGNGLAACTYDDAQRYACTRRTFEGRHVCVLEDMDPTYRIAEEDRPSRCAERYLCIPSEASSWNNSEQFGRELDDGSGDLRCGDQGGMASFPALQQVGTELSSAGLLRACIGELTDDDPTQNASANQLVADLLRDGQCIRRGAFARALHWAAGPARQAAAQGRRSTDEEAGAIALRLLQQWIAIHTFVANEAVQLTTMQSVVNRAEQAVSLDLATGVVMAGFRDLLSEDAGAILAGVPETLLLRADYRSQFGARDVNMGHSDIGTSIAVTMVEGVTAGLRLAAEHLTMAHFGRAELSPQATTRARELADLSLQVLALAAAHRGGPSQEWSRGVHTLIVERRKVFARLAAIESGANPLGISEEDLPILQAATVTDATERMFAVSGEQDRRYYAPALADAERALTALETATHRRADRRVQSIEEGLRTEDRLVAIKERFGGELLALCGEVGGMATAQDVAESVADVDDPQAFVSTCFVDVALPGCWASGRDRKTEAGQGGLERAFCIAGELRRHLGSSMRFDDPALDEAVERVILPNSDPSTYEGRLALLFARDLAMSRGEADALLARILDFGLPLVSTAEGAQVLVRAQAHCAGFDTVHETLPHPLAGGPSADDPGQPGCFGGTLGSAALDMMVAAAEVEAALLRAKEGTRLYEMSMEGCDLSELSNQQRVEAEAALNEQLDDIRNQRRVFDGIVAVVKLGAAVGAKNSSAAGGALEQMARAAFGFEDREATLREVHQEEMAKLQAETELKHCYLNAEKHLVSTDTAKAAAQAALLRLAAAQVQFANQRDRAVRLTVELAVGLDREASRTRPSLMSDFWVDEASEVYRKRFRRLQREAFLLIRAIEFEAQQSLAGAREAVLSAVRPAGVGEAITSAKSHLDRASLGNAPTDAVLLISLRDHVLGLGYTLRDGDGWQAMTPSQQFVSLLSSKAMAAYGRDGTYLGQRIRFALAPDLPGAQLDEIASTEAFSPNFCAERIWTVGVGVRGAQVLNGLAAPQFIVRQRNTFSSQRCGDASDALQTNTTNPGKNLHLDPESAFDGDAAAQGSQLNVRRYSELGVQAAVGPTDEELRGDEFAGQVSGFAGRALFSEYELIIPSDAISRNGGNGWVLGNMSDIVLRIGAVRVSRSLE